MEKPTFCRICEPTCGMIATVSEGKLTGLRPDPEHPISAGFSCPKGPEFLHVNNDEDRILHPLRRRPDGTFEQISWDTALREIGARLRAVRDVHGGESIGVYIGNPSGFSHSHGVWVTGFVKAIGTQHLYSPNTQDTASRLVASTLLYSNPFLVPVPDLERSHFVLLLGTNPLVSRGSLVSAGNLREKLTGVVSRGGRVVVIDPRRTETARAFEHVSVRPDGDAWLLLAMLNVIFNEGLEDREAISKQSKDIRVIREAANRYSPEAVQDRTGLPPAEVRALARAIATAPSAAIHGRTGACLGRHATLVNVLLDTLAVVTGNLDRDGGLVFGCGPVDFASMAARLGLATYDTYRSRVGGFPEVISQLPAPLMAEEITTPGRGQMRALIVTAGNPVLSVPGAAEFEQALDQLDFQVGIDLYLNETHRHADYVLPAATFYERSDMMLVAMDLHLSPFVQWTDAVVEPRGEARPDWQIMDSLARELGVRPLAGFARSFLPRRFAKLATRLLSPATGWVTPEVMIDLLLRTGSEGDWFGLRPGKLSVAALRATPRGRVLSRFITTGTLKSRVRGGRVNFGDKRIAEALQRLADEPQADPSYPMLLIGKRDVRSHNSWMHNTPKHRDPHRRQRGLMNPKDAAGLGIADGDSVRITSATGTDVVPVQISDEVAPGTVAVPHGWGHRDAGWQTANEAGGMNVNAILSARTADLEPLSGMSHLNAVPVRLEPVHT
jgi:anaerobic selenocysteine-containing dehydrogenase